MTSNTKTESDVVIRETDFDNLRRRITQLESIEYNVTRETDLDNLRRRITQLESIENSAKVKQVLDENVQIRDDMAFLRGKISRFESIETSLLAKISDFERRFGSEADGGPILLDEEEAVRTFEEEVQEEETFPSDTFSFMAISHPLSKPFILSTIVVLFQITAFSLVAYSIVTSDDSNPLNPFGVPGNVASVVRFTQMIAIIIAVVTQDDIRTSLNMLLEGYQKENLRTKFRYIKRWKWMLSIIGRLVEGSLGLVVTFLLIVTVDTVMGILLGFTAMAFVSQLDEVCFFMSLQGFFGSANNKTAMIVSTTKIRRKRTKQQGHMYRAISLIFLLVALFVGWVIIARNQLDGVYLCSTFFVQFGDDFNGILGTYSGLYDQRLRSGPSLFAGLHFDYVDRQSGTAAISYCEDLEAWTFSKMDPEGKIDPCNWIARSDKTSTFDLARAASLAWFVRNAVAREAVLEPFFLSCYECDNDLTAEGSHTRCSGRGLCKNAVCACDEGWYGLRCEFREPCQELEFDGRFGPFRGNHRWASGFSRFEFNNESINAYHKPVYINEYSQGLFDILVFTGRRWVATYSGLLDVASPDGQSGKEALVKKYFNDDFHPAGGGFSFAFISEPVDFGKSKGSTSPIGLQWYAMATLAIDTPELADTEDFLLSPIDPLLLCAVCDDRTNTCLYDGECINGTCQCSLGSSGALCQSPPLGNGRCDLFYNTLEFEYDGGDCCESTCVSSDSFTCGRDESGYVNLGYYFCHMHEEEWILAGETISGEISSGSGHAVKLSDNGQILVVAEPGLDRVRLFDKDGSQWIQRIHLIQGEPRSKLGSSLAVSHVSMFNTPISMTPIVIAVGNNLVLTGKVFVYECSFNACLQQGDDIIAFQNLDPIFVEVDVSSDGRIIVAGARTAIAPKQTHHPYPLAIFRRQGRHGGWVRDSLDMTFGDLEGVYSVALSGMGDVLAVASYEAGFSPGRGTWIVNNTRRVYAWNGTIWAQRGGTMVEATPHRSLLYNVQFQSMDISFDGNVLAHGLLMTRDERSTSTRIFAWVVFESGWIQRGAPVRCGEMELQGWSVSLSSDGKIVAISASEYSEGYAPVFVGNGEACSFNWNGNAWEMLGNPLASSYKSSIAISADGSHLAIGMPNTGEGHSSVYKYPRNGCPNGTSLLHVSITLDDRPHSTTWSVFSNDTGKTMLQGGPYVRGAMFSTTTGETCVASDGCTIFTIYDNLDLNGMPGVDGMNAPGGYALFIEGQRIPSGNITGAVDRQFIGNCLSCPVGTRLFRLLVQTCASVAWKLVDTSGEELFSNDSFDDYFFRPDNVCSLPDQTTYWEEQCIPVETCLYFSIDALSVADFTVAQQESDDNDNATARRLGTDPLVDGPPPADGPPPESRPPPLGGPFPGEWSSGLQNLEYRLFMDKEEIAWDTALVTGREKIESVVFIKVCP